MKAWSWRTCLENGFDLASDARVPTVKPDAMYV